MSIKILCKNKVHNHTLGTNIRARLRKQQKTIANATKAKLASCWLAMTMVTGAVIKHNITTL